MELLTIRETADLLRVAPITVRRYVAAKRLSSVRVGRLVRIRREDVEKLLVRDARDDKEDPLAHVKPFTTDGPYWNLVGIAKNEVPNDVADGKYRYLAEAYAGLHEEPTDSKPDVKKRPKRTSKNDPLWKIVGIGQSSGPNDVAQNKYKYLAETYMPKDR